MPVPFDREKPFILDAQKLLVTDHPFERVSTAVRTLFGMNAIRPSALPDGPMGLT